MITVYCALYAEAQEIIHAFRLKKEAGPTHFQTFSNEENTVRTVITGAGGIQAATAVAETNICYPPEKSDLLINYGICGAPPEIPVGSIFICNKITEECSMRTFYPDLLYRHPFLEAELRSCGKPRTPETLEVNTEDDSEGGIREEHWGGRTRLQKCLYDMEAAAIYQAGSYSYGPHQMIFLKVVSDHGVFSNTQKQLAGLMESAASPVCSFLDFLRKLSHDQWEEWKEQSGKRNDVKEEAKVLGEKLHCSLVMRRKLEQLLWYGKLTGVEYREILKEYERDGRMPVKDKREGKKLLDELKRRILQP